jgi:hypothetical protein
VAVRSGHTASASTFPSRYRAKDEAIIRRHAEVSGFPATKITEVRRIIDPTTAAG